MQIRYSANEAEILAPAKVNLFFAVLYQRKDGFHEIESLMAPISLFDTLILQEDHSGQITLDCSWCGGFRKYSGPGESEFSAAAESFKPIPTGEQNIVVRAARLLQQAAKTTHGAKIRLVKRIPAEAGLGGGSSDAAATLIAANYVWKLRWSIEQLAELAAQIGSDVPFFLAGGPAVCRGRGEKIEPISGLGTLPLVIVRPPEGLSTAAVYQTRRPDDQSPAVDTLLSSLRKRDWSEVERIAHNGLLPAARELLPCIGKVIERLKESNCPMVGMSGSGSSCFAVARNHEEANRLALQLRNEQIGAVWSVRTL